MSLNSNGSQFVIQIPAYTTLNHKTGQYKDLASFNTVPSIAMTCDLEARKKAFMLAMEQVTNTEFFEAFTSRLQDDVKLNIQYSVSTQMPV